MRLRGLDDQRGLGCSKPGHFEFQVRLAVGSCLGRKFRDVRCAIDSRGHQRTRDSFSILLFSDGNMQIGALSRKPAFRIDQFHCERRLSNGMRMRRRFGLIGSRLFLQGHRRWH